MGRSPSITWAALITKGGRSGRSGLPVGPDPRVPCQGLDHQRVEVPTRQLPGSPVASGRRRERSGVEAPYSCLVRRSEHFLLTSSRCPRRRAAGVTRKATQRSRGMTRLAAARRTCVDGPELAWARRPLQHPELMAENEDLEVPGSVVSALLATAKEETDEGADDEVEEGQHRPIVPGLSERESGFPTPTGHARRLATASSSSSGDGSPSTGTCSQAIPAASSPAVI